MIDAERGTVSPLEALSLAAVWSPDGSRIAQPVMLGGDQAIQTIDPFRAGPATEIVKRSHGRKLPYDWSINGDLLYGVNEDARGALWTAPVAGGKEPVRLAELQSQWTLARFSPDARWFAYTDERGGVPQIFVESNPPGRGHRQISTDGGIDPRWRRDGRELFYIDPRGRMMSVEGKPGEGFDAGAPKELFTFRGMNNAYTTARYDVTGDGQRFLILTPLESTPSDPMNVVQNWTKGFKP
jgi:eukaryotic-like serine/threonine-protein kinase